MSMICLADFEAFAKRRLSTAVWDFYAGGADDCESRDRNLLAFKRIYLRPRLLRDVSMVDTSTIIQGSALSFPVGIAPTGFQSLACPDGEIGSAKAAKAMNICYVTSTLATYSVEEIAAVSTSACNWFQLYVFKKRVITEQLVKRVNSLGYKSLVVTVDLPFIGKRRQDILNHFKIPTHLTLKNLEAFKNDLDSLDKSGLCTDIIDPSFSWKDIQWLQSLTDLPIILKGILTREDAELAVRHGVQGIIVSNHGGRQLDGVHATIEVLSEVVEAVKGRIEVYMDGGIRRGTDVLKALAIGAKCVFIGRPIIWGLAYKGEEGVKDLLQILKAEFHTAMALSGCKSISEIDRSLVQVAKL
uniref:(S)-2-hydroxy-acid oxidase n=1 Tax=Callorhinchus milii TaxID=7868 RepID=A0A4W3HIR5_CALMI|eukprot:gi/632935505/ref/XP_007890323.1/ PREDICTED: hydroxyacid oxidase 2-like [Callorhinchus milii]